MANSLKLMWGNYEQLPKSAELGAIYVTKDEGSIYLGTTSGKAPVRLQGTVQYFATLTDWQAAIKPPYSEDVIYYIANQNALVRWDSTKTSTEKPNGSFVVLNVTAEEFGALSTTVGTLNTTVTTMSTNLDNLIKTGGTIDTIEAEIDALSKFLGMSGEGEEGSAASLLDKIAALEGWRDEVKPSIAEIAGIKTDLGEKANQSDLKTLKDNYDEHILQYTEDVTGFTESLEGVTEALGGINDRLGGIDETIAGINTRVGENATTLGTIAQDYVKNQQLVDAKTELGNSITNAEKAAKAYTDTETGKLTSAIATTNATVGGIQTAITQINGKFKDYKTVEDAKKDHEALQAEIVTKIQAANCLEYVGEIDDASDITKITSAKNGATYIVTATVGNVSKNNLSNVTLYAGDLLIVSGAEGTDGTVPADDIEWIHVQSGYVENHLPTLSVASNKIELKALGGTGSSLGSTTFTTDESSNIAISTSGNNINFSLEWIEFGSSTAAE